MLTTGIDMIEIHRVQKSLENPSFLRGVYGEVERMEWEKQGSKAESAAARFAAKEAFSKAMGTGLRGFSLPEVEVLHDELGAPYFVLSGKAKELVREKGVELSLSITHTKEFATAMVVAYPKGAF